MLTAFVGEFDVAYTTVKACANRTDMLANNVGQQCWPTCLYGLYTMLVTSPTCWKRKICWATVLDHFERVQNEPTLFACMKAVCTVCAGIQHCWPTNIIFFQFRISNSVLTILKLLHSVKQKRKQSVDVF